jgi:hypothetical protein
MHPPVMKCDTMTSYVGRGLKDPIMKVAYPNIKDRRSVLTMQWKEYCKKKKNAIKKKQA